VRCLLGCLTVLTRHQVSRDAELLVVRHENAVLRRELLDRLLIVNEHHLRRVLTGYLQHYNTGRPHEPSASSHRLKLALVHPGPRRPPDRPRRALQQNPPAGRAHPPRGSDRYARSPPQPVGGTVVGRRPTTGRRGHRSRREVQAGLPLGATSGVPGGPVRDPADRRGEPGARPGPGVAAVHSSVGRRANDRDHLRGGTGLSPDGGSAGRGRDRGRRGRRST